MKTFNPISNLILLLSIYLFFNSCSVTGPEETDLEIDMPTEIDSDLPNTSISLDSIVGLDFNKLTAVSLKGQSKVNDDGTFYIEEVNAINENLPILFLKDNEIMFGYFPKANNGNSINLDDLLLFYVSINPEIAIQGLDNSELSKMIISNKNYDELKKQV